MVSITSIIVLISLIALGSSQTCDFTTDLCSRSSVDCGSLTLRDTSSGNRLTVGSNSYSGNEFDVISFNSLTIVNGDIQGRVAVKNDFYGIQGISVADLITDASMYSLIVGGSLTWGSSGELYPLNAGMFVGSPNPTLPANLVNRVAGSCNTSQCLDASFDTLYNYWGAFSASIAAQSSNVDHSLGSNGMLTLNCQAAGSVYFANIDSSIFNQVVGYTIAASCSSSATWVINIVGSGEVYFGGNSIVATGDIIFNIGGTARRIIVAASINGHVVAPNSNLNMLGGTIYGKVIASNVTVIQVNRPTCPVTTGSTVTGSTVTGSTVTGSSVTGSTVTGSDTETSATGSTVTGSTVTGSTVTGSTVTGSDTETSATGSTVTGSSNSGSASTSTASSASGSATEDSAIENGANSEIVGSASTSSSIIVVPSLIVMFIASLLF